MDEKGRRKCQIEVRCFIRCFRKWIERLSRIVPYNYPIFIITLSCFFFARCAWLRNVGNLSPVCTLDKLCSSFFFSLGSGSRNDALGRCEIRGILGNIVNANAIKRPYNTLCHKYWYIKFALWRRLQVNKRCVQFFPWISSRKISPRIRTLRANFLNN